jgi:hypothetical protein
VAGVNRAWHGCKRKSSGGLPLGILNGALGEFW